ncbi:unnamed protein product [Rotaria sordida]|uniref:Uncharacterized protein n=1 Tax=Rotaria sordida TaxID=392033 RepID=A0A813S6I6_9BILA|nr:unnamed protein product [Rotaria sordida]CAF0791923.1 unnamed protein product [Rotaria sordida]
MQSPICIVEEEARNLSSQDDDIHSHQSLNENYQAANNTKETLSCGSHSNESRSHSSILIPPFNTFDIASSTNNSHDHLLDSDKNSSFLTGSSFDASLNSLKSIHET